MYRAQCIPFGIYIKDLKGICAKISASVRARVVTFFLALVQSRALVLSREAWLHVIQAGKQGECSVIVLELGGWPMWRGRG